jgi:hypothetical protein
MRTHGRYVRIDAKPSKQWCLFADEIEVYRGEDAWLAEPRPPTAFPDEAEPLATQQFNSVLKPQLRRDVDAIRQDMAEYGIGAAELQTVEGELVAISRRITEMPVVAHEGFRAVLPMTELEREIFQLQAQVWRAQGKPDLRIWKGHRWDPLPPSGEPEDDSPPALAIDVMRGETRADVVNVTNADEADQTVRVTVAGLPGGPDPEYLVAYEVLCVGARWFEAVSAALVPAERDGDDYVLTVPSGMTRQVWLSFARPALDAWSYEARVTVTGSSGAETTVPLRLTVHDLDFPEWTTLRLGCWDYTDGDGIRGVTPENRLALVARLRDLGLSASQLGLLVFDEPCAKQHCDVTPPAPGRSARLSRK